MDLGYGELQVLGSLMKESLVRFGATFIIYCICFSFLALSSETFTMKHSEILFKLFSMASMELSLRTVRQALAKRSQCKVRT